MKAFNKLFAGSAAAIAITLTSVLGFTAAASADCMQYNANGTSTTATPIFNNFCGVPNSVGNESDFVRLRADNGDPTSAATNADYISTLNTACNDNDKFDVRTYIHNGADPSGNASGVAVAHNVQLAMSAPLGATNSSFNFGSRVTASNAASVSDTGTLNCNGKQVKLSLVPSSVHVYSKSYGWNGLGDGAVNGTTKLGSPTMGSGDQNACWDFRIVVVYAVKVNVIPTPKPKPQVTATCDLLSVVAGDERKVKVSQFKYTTVNASIKNVVLNWGDNSSAVTLTDASKVVGLQHQYAKDSRYTITAVITFSDNTTQKQIVSGGVGTACVQQVSYTTPNQPPTIVTPPVTVTPNTPTAVVAAEQPTTLVNTGAGSVAGIFAATTAAGAVAYRYVIGRRLSRQ